MQPPGQSPLPSGPNTAENADLRDLNERVRELSSQFNLHKEQMDSLPAKLVQLVQAFLIQVKSVGTQEVGVRELIPKMPPGKRSKASIHRLLKAGKIPAKKIDRRWVFDPVAVRERLDRDSEGDALDKFLAAHKRPRRRSSPNGQPPATDTTGALSVGQAG